MAQMILVEPFTLVHAGAAPTFSASRGAGAANLVSIDPREVWLDSGVPGNAQINIDLGVSTAWDTIALINVRAAATATWAITGGAGYTGTTYQPATALKLPSEDGSIDTAPALYYSAAGNNGRYIRLTFSAVDAPAISFGVLLVGKSWRPTLPREQGAGRPPIDSGSRSRLDNGGLATVPGTLVSGFRWVFGDLEPADLKRLWGIFRRRRTTEPMLLVEDPDEQYAEVVHYGTMIDLESWERRDASKSRLAMSFEDWL